MVSHGQGGLRQGGHFADKGGESQFFDILCRRLYGRVVEYRKTR